ncbi:hypothetical protein ACWCRG_43660, partial [Streptomyces formicae]
RRSDKSRSMTRKHLVIVGIAGILAASAAPASAGATAPPPAPAPSTADRGPGPGWDCEECLEKNLEKYLDALLKAKKKKYDKLFKGATGPAGPKGAPGLAGVHTVNGPEVPIPVLPGEFPGRAVATAECPAGEKALGGGANVTAGNSHAERYQLVSTLPLSDGTTWWAFALNSDENDPGTMQAYVNCAKVAP